MQPGLPPSPQGSNAERASQEVNTSALANFSTNSAELARIETDLRRKYEDLQSFAGMSEVRGGNIDQNFFLLGSKTALDSAKNFGMRIKTRYQELTHTSVEETYGIDPFGLDEDKKAQAKQLKGGIAGAITGGGSVQIKSDHTKVTLMDDVGKSPNGKMTLPIVETYLHENVHALNLKKTLRLDIRPFLPALLTGGLELHRQLLASHESITSFLRETTSSPALIAAGFLTAGLVGARSYIMEKKLLKGSALHCYDELLAQASGHYFIDGGECGEDFFAYFAKGYPQMYKTNGDKFVKQVYQRLYLLAANGYEMGKLSREFLRFADVKDKDLKQQIIYNLNTRIREQVSINGAIPQAQLTSLYQELDSDRVFNTTAVSSTPSGKRLPFAASSQSERYSICDELLQRANCRARINGTAYRLSVQETAGVDIDQIIQDKTQSCLFDPMRGRRSAKEVVDNLYLLSDQQENALTRSLNLPEGTRIGLKVTIVNQKNWLLRRGSRGNIGFVTIDMDRKEKINNVLNVHNLDPRVAKAIYEQYLTRLPRKERKRVERELHRQMNAGARTQLVDPQNAMAELMNFDH
jgi:hypothetical protein